MFKPFSFYIGLRYTRAKRRNHFISFISLTSILGITLGITALITVLSVMNGFEKELKNRMLSMSAHVVIDKYGGIENWRALVNQVKSQEHVTAVAPFIEGQGMVSFHKNVHGAMLQGILPEFEVNASQINEKMVLGKLESLKSGDFGVVIGSELAYALNVTQGDKITLVVPQAAVTPIGVLPRMKRMTIKGIFTVGMHEYDSALVLLNLEDAAKLLRMPKNTISGLNIRLDEMFSAPTVSQQLQNTLDFGYRSYDWTLRHSNIFKAIKMEKAVMFIILTLIIAVAAFNIISTLVMVVTDKQSDIAILRTLGATPATIMRIFMVQGSITGILGTLLGLACGITLAMNVENIVPAIESYLNIDVLPSSVYYISDVPSDLRWPDVYKITLISLMLSFLATIYPAWQAARTQPAEALRYE